MQKHILLILFILVNILNAQNHENVEQVGSTYAHWESAKDVFIRDTLAYIAAGYSGLKIVDISNLEQLDIVGCQDEMSGSIEKVMVSGDFAYILGEDIYVININDPTEPELIGEINFDDPIYSIEISGNNAYIGGFYLLYVLDISNPAEIVEVGRCRMPGYCKDIWLDGEYAYVANHSEGFSIIDISDPSSPHEVVSYDTFGYCSHIAVCGDITYLSHSYGFIILDVSNTEEPEEIAICHLDYGAYDEVVTMINGKVNTGYHTTVWEANVPSGLYACRMEAGCYSKSIKLLLNKIMSKLS